MLWFLYFKFLVAYIQLQHVHFPHTESIVDPQFQHQLRHRWESETEKRHYELKAMIEEMQHQISELGSDSEAQREEIKKQQEEITSLTSQMSEVKRCTQQLKSEQDQRGREQRKKIDQ